jgi:hypothetical protein
MDEYVTPVGGQNLSKRIRFDSVGPGVIHGDRESGGLGRGSDGGVDRLRGISRDSRDSYCTGMESAAPNSEAGKDGREGS